MLYRMQWRWVLLVICLGGTHVISTKPRRKCELGSRVDRQNQPMPTTSFETHLSHLSQHCNKTCSKNTVPTVSHTRAAGKVREREKM